MVKEHKLSTRYRVVGMIKGSMTQAQVARDLGVAVVTIRHRQTHNCQGET